MFSGYYQKNKEKLSKQAHERYKILSEKESSDILVSEIEMFLKKKKKKKTIFF